jgi:hypothetical protein
VLVAAVRFFLGDLHDRGLLGALTRSFGRGSRSTSAICDVRLTWATLVKATKFALQAAACGDTPLAAQPKLARSRD